MPKAKSDHTGPYAKENCRGDRNEPSNIGQEILDGVKIKRLQRPEKAKDAHTKRTFSTKNHQGETKAVSGCFCKPARCEFTDHTGLGARTKTAARPCQVALAHCRASSGDFGRVTIIPNHLMTSVLLGKMDEMGSRNLRLPHEKMSLDLLAERVCEVHGVRSGELLSGSRRHDIIEARRVMSWLSVRELGGIRRPRLLGISGDELLRYPGGFCGRSPDREKYL